MSAIVEAFLMMNHLELDYRRQLARAETADERIMVAGKIALDPGLTIFERQKLLQFADHCVKLAGTRLGAV